MNFLTTLILTLVMVVSCGKKESAAKTAAALPAGTVAPSPDATGKITATAKAGEAITISAQNLNSKNPYAKFFKMVIPENSLSRDIDITIQDASVVDPVTGNYISPLMATTGDSTAVVNPITVVNPFIVSDSSSSSLALSFSINTTKNPVAPTDAECGVNTTQDSCPVDRCEWQILDYTAPATSSSCVALTLCVPVSGNITTGQGGQVAPQLTSDCWQMEDSFPVVQVITGTYYTNAGGADVTVSPDQTTMSLRTKQFATFQARTVQNPSGLPQGVYPYGDGVGQDGVNINTGTQAVANTMVTATDTSTDPNGTISATVSSTVGADSYDYFLIVETSEMVADPNSGVPACPIEWHFTSPRKNSSPIVLASQLNVPIATPLSIPLTGLSLTMAELQQANRFNYAAIQSLPLATTGPVVLCMYGKLKGFPLNNGNTVLVTNATNQQITRTLPIVDSQYIATIDGSSGSATFDLAAAGIASGTVLTACVYGNDITGRVAGFPNDYWDFPVGNAPYFVTSANPTGNPSVDPSSYAAVTYPITTLNLSSVDGSPFIVYLLKNANKCSMPPAAAPRQINNFITWTYSPASN